LAVNDPMAVALVSDAQSAQDLIRIGNGHQNGDQSTSLSAVLLGEDYHAENDRSPKRHGPIS
jgi:hypothetical protein